MNYSHFRIQHGLHWRKKYPSPLDYKQESRFVAALMLILFMLWLAASMLNAESALASEEVAKDSYRNAVLACVNQAATNDGRRVAYTFDNRIINVKCEDFGVAEKRR